METQQLVTITASASATPSIRRLQLTRVAPLPIRPQLKCGQTGSPGRTADTEKVDPQKLVNAGICPDCGQPLKKLYHNHKTDKDVFWSRPVDSIYLDIWQAEEIAGTGYYRINHNRDWSGYTFSPSELIKLEEMESEAAQKPPMNKPITDRLILLARRNISDFLQANVSRAEYEQSGTGRWYCN